MTLIFTCVFTCFVAQNSRVTGCPNLPSLTLFGLDLPNHSWGDRASVSTWRPLQRPAAAWKNVPPAKNHLVLGWKFHGMKTVPHFRTHRWMARHNPRIRDGDCHELEYRQNSGPNRNKTTKAEPKSSGKIHQTMVGSWGFPQWMMIISHISRVVEPLNFLSITFYRCRIEELRSKISHPQPCFLSLAPAIEWSWGPPDGALFIIDLDDEPMTKWKISRGHGVFFVFLCLLIPTNLEWLH